jgi:cytochrome P450
VTLVPRASARDSAGVVADVVAPLAGRGVIVRRPRVVGVLDRMDADRRAVRRLQTLRHRYGDGPVLLRVPGREVAFVLSPSHVRRVLDGSPEPFAIANREKRAALSHFQPHGVLISQGAERAERRRFNEEVLDFGRPVHRLGDEIALKVAQEASAMLAGARAAGALAWDEFAVAWWRMVRRVVLGDAARDEHRVTDLLTKLRGDANWAYLKPKRRRLRAQFLELLAACVQRAEPGSLAHLVVSAPSSPSTYPLEQVPQWLFAFDSAGMATFRALALLAAHPDQSERVESELVGRDLSAAQDLPLLRSCLLESVRLWPTTPAVLRDTTADTDWAGRTLPAGAAVVIFAPYFHRDDERLPYADRFEPALWTDGAMADGWPLIPFSAGPGECAGRDLVLLTTSLMLANVLAAGRPSQMGEVLASETPLPRTLSPFRLRFEASRS